MISPRLNGTPAVDKNLGGPGDVGIILGLGVDGGGGVESVDAALSKSVQVSWNSWPFERNKWRTSWLT